MKKLIVLLALAPAALPAAKLCRANYTAGTGSTSTEADKDWTWTLTGSGVPTITGTSVCSDGLGDTDPWGLTTAVPWLGYTPSVSSGVEGVAENAVRCYCKITSPKPGNWVLVYVRTNPSHCIHWCSFDCSFHARNSSTLFLSLSAL